MIPDLGRCSFPEKMLAARGIAGDLFFLCGSGCMSGIVHGGALVLPDEQPSAIGEALLAVARVAPVVFPPGAAVKRFRSPNRYE
jgi:hypothetical protein